MTTSTVSSANPPSLFKSYFIWGLGAFFYFYETMLIVSPSVMVPELMLHFETTAEHIGNLASFYFYAYAAMQIPVGLLMDRFGPRRLLTIASLLCALGSFGFVLSQNWYLAASARFLMGIGGGFAVVGCMKLASLWFPVNRFAILTGMMVAIGMTGAVFGQAPLAHVSQWIGWQNTLMVLGTMGIGLAAVIWFSMVQQPPRDLHHQDFDSEMANHSQLSMTGMLVTIMKSPQIWLAGIYAGLMFVPTAAFGELWGVPYLETRYGIDTAEAGWLMSALFIGWVVCGPCYGWFSERLGRRILPMGIAALGSLVLCGIMLTQEVSIVKMWPLLFALGGLSCGFVLAFSLVREITSPALIGTAIGFLNTLNNAFAAFGQYSLGHLVDHYWDGTLSAQGMPEYNLSAYHSALILLPIVTGLAVLILPLIKETFCRPAFAAND